MVYRARDWISNRRQWNYRESYPYEDWAWLSGIMKKECMNTSNAIAYLIIAKGSRKRINHWKDSTRQGNAL